MPHDAPVRNLTSFSRGRFKTTLRQLDAACSQLNMGVLKTTPFGVGVERSGDEVAVIRRARRPSHMHMAGVIFNGSHKKCAAYLEGLAEAATFYRKDSQPEEMPFRNDWPMSLARTGQSTMLAP